MKASGRARYRRRVATLRLERRSGRKSPRDFMAGPPVDFRDAVERTLARLECRLLVGLVTDDEEMAMQFVRRTFGPESSSSNEAATEREPHSGARSAVRFVSSEQPLVSVLEVLAPAEWEVIAEVYRELHALRVQVVHTLARHAPHTGMLEHRMDIVEFDGAKLDPRRHDEVLFAVETKLRLIETNQGPPRSVVRPRAPQADRTEPRSERTLRVG